MQLSGAVQFDWRFESNKKINALQEREFVEIDQFTPYNGGSSYHKPSLGTPPLSPTTSCEEPRLTNFTKCCTCCRNIFRRKRSRVTTLIFMQENVRKCLLEFVSIAASTSIYSLA